MRARRALPLLLALALALAGCGEGHPPVDFAPIRSDYLTPLRLDVARLEVGPVPQPDPQDAGLPVTPGQALRQLIEDRLSAAGTAGEARVTLQEARVRQTSRGLAGAMAVRIDLSSPTRSGFAEARVERSVGDPDDDARVARYELIKRLVADMNVELEYQVRRSLGAALQSAGAAPPPASVRQQPLPPPGRPARP